MEVNKNDLNEENKNEIKEEDQKIPEVPSENKQQYQKYFRSKSFMPKFTGKSIKSGASSFTNDSSLNNEQLSSSRDSEEKRIKRGIDIEYPSLKRSHSTKKYHYSKDYKKDIIKEEKNEDEDSFSSFASNKSKFSSYTIMPKESNLFFFEKRKLFDENTIKNISTMEPVPETYDENLIFQKPKMQILSDKKEDSKLNVITSSTINVKLSPSLTVLLLPVTFTVVPSMEADFASVMRITLSAYSTTSLCVSSICVDLYVSCISLKAKSLSVAFT